MKAAAPFPQAILPILASLLEADLATAGLRTIATTTENGRATDLAIVLSSLQLAVVRCADRIDANDHAELAMMVAEGDFVWAGLVCREAQNALGPGLIESFSLVELDRLVERLVQVREGRLEAP